MTSTTQNPSEQDAQSKPGTSPRSNPVCLELSVTLRSLPTEASAQAQPIREELKTVIVFDNGAVLRSTNNLPGGMTLILSNANGRDVVCRVVTGRSMPSVKGYVEIEFMEPVKDFWDIHKESAPAAASVPAVPPAPKTQSSAPSTPVRREVPTAPSSSASTTRPPQPAAMPSVRPAPPVEPPRADASALSGPLEYDEFPAPTGNMGMPAPSSRPEPIAPPEPVSPAPWTSPKNSAVPEKPTAEYSHLESTAATSVANWTPPPPEPPAAPRQMQMPEETASAISQAAPAPARDFLSKGLMAYEKPASSDASSASKTPLILGAAALILASVCGAVFFMHRGNGAAPTAKAAAVNPAPAPRSPTASNAPAPPTVQVQAAPPSQPAPEQSAPQPQAQMVAAQPVQPTVAVAPIPPAEITLNSASNPVADSAGARRQGKTPAAQKQAQPPAPKRPMISDLKMAAPSAPNRSVEMSTDAAAPVAEIASADMSAEVANASLLSSSTRAAAAPAAPAAPPPPMKVVTDPKLISSARPVYPQSARQANVEGAVTLVIYIDQTGKVFNARSLSGPVMLRAAAEEAVKQWKYSPGLEDGKPVQSHIVVRVDFKISN
jgi:periplasmic protein TonB